MSIAGLPAREAALTALRAVLDKEFSLDVAWREAKLTTLDPRDVGFARVLVLTTLRRLGSIDAVLDQFLRKRPVGGNAVAVHIMRIAAAELLALDGAAHAAVDSAVRLTKKQKNLGKLSGMVNAVCRKVAGEGVRLFDQIDSEKVDTPAWLWMRLVHDYGEETARGIATAHRNGAPLDLSIRDDPAGWSVRLAGTLLPSETVRLTDAGAVPDLLGYTEGAWWAQDAAAALPARLLGDVKGKRVLDLCAAPGGKTMQLAAAGAHVTALDLSEVRMKRLIENLTRTRLSVDVVTADALDWEPKEAFDAILLDAPCSATGTIRRHPDLPYLKSGKELTSLVPLQDALLDRSVGWLKPGGAMVYAVCSLLPAEGPRRMRAFLDRTPGIEMIPLMPGAGIDPEMIVDGALRTLPHHWTDRGGIDGFYAARLRKAAEPSTLRLV